MSNQPTVRIAVIGLNHYHIYHLVDVLVEAGADLASYFAVEDDLAGQFSQRYPQARRAGHIRQVLEDESIQVVVCAAIPDERAHIGVQAMQHGKDFFVDKPGFTTLEQVSTARQAHADTGRTFSVGYGRLTSKAMNRAGALIKGGAIGRPLQTIGLGPHRLNAAKRPDWFFERKRYGGIIADLGTHLVDQFLYFTGSSSAEVVTAQVGNYNHPQYPELEDFGDAVLRGDSGQTGYLRVDWFTPDGLGTFGDQRLIVTGTDGYIEVRGTCDLAGRPGGQHLFLVDQTGVQYLDCRNEEVEFGERFLDDVRHRTQIAIDQDHCFRVAELTLSAQDAAQAIPT